MRFPLPGEELEIGFLLVVAGPSTVGKSSFISQLHSGSLDREIRSRIPVAVDGWTLGAPRFLARPRRGDGPTRRVSMPGLIYHYETTRLLRLGLESFGEDRGLDMIKAARRVLIVDLRAPSDVLAQHAIRRIARGERLGALQRLFRALSLGVLRSGDSLLDASGPTAEVLEAYREPGWVDGLYAKWDAFLDEAWRTGPEVDILAVEPVARRYAPPTFRLRVTYPRSAEREPSAAAVRQGCPSAVPRA